MTELVPAPVATGRGGGVATAHPLASAAGAAVLTEGGNAVDAAVTAALTLGVVEPFASGIGGGGFLTLRLAAGETAFLDFRETAPAELTPDLYLRAAANGQKRADNLGPLPIGVPGQLAGMAEALRRWGTISLARALQPGIEHAEAGFQITRFMAQIMPLNVTRLRLSADGRRLFLDDAGQPRPEGAVIRQPELAATYRALAAEGPSLFYTGELGRRIVEHVRGLGGVLSLADLAGYRPVLRQPVVGRFRDAAIVSAPPPSSGGFAVALLLQLWDALGVVERPADDAGAVHLLVEAMKLAFADRARYAADPAFVDVPVAGLMDPAYARARAVLVDPARPGQPMAGQPTPAGSPSTTHLSVIDGAGNAVALTQTLQDLFGSGVMVPGAGVMLNNELRDFDTTDLASPNAPAAGKRPLSSQSPTIVVRGGQAALVLGSAGSKRIITAVAQTILQHVGRDQPLPEAIAMPRYHCDDSSPEVAVERIAPPRVLDGLRALGHPLREPRTDALIDAYLGGVQAVARAADGSLTAVCDPRRAGQPAAI